MPTLIESWQLRSGSELEKEHGEEEAWRTEEDGEGLLYRIYNNPHLAGGENMVPGCSEHG